MGLQDMDLKNPVVVMCPYLYPTFTFTFTFAFAFTFTFTTQRTTQHTT